jgi:tRNA(fMet)-specific endonuclease VapC
MKYMFDTNICIYARKGMFPALANRLPNVRKGDACISVITYGELLVGAAKSTQSAAALAAVERTTSLLSVYPLDEDVAETYADIRAHLEHKGTPIGTNDLWIGAHALTLGVTLITNNDKEFKRIPKLKIENWTK